MAIATCFSLILKQSAFNNSKVLSKVVHTLRKMQTDSDIDVRDIALNCSLPPKNTLEGDDDDDDDGSAGNDNAGNLNETFFEQSMDRASLSNASTVDMNSSDGNGSFSKDNDESDESQDSIRLYLDTDEKNSSEFKQIEVYCKSQHQYYVFEILGFLFDSVKVVPKELP